ALLRADVERHADRVEAQSVGMLEHVDRHLRIAAEFPRQRPFGTGAAEQEAAEHLGAGGGAGDLVHFGFAVDREKPDAERKGAVAMSRSFLMGWANERRSAEPPAASTISISATEAVSKQEPSLTRSCNSSGAGFALTA